VPPPPQGSTSAPPPPRSAATSTAAAASRRSAWVAGPDFRRTPGVRARPRLYQYGHEAAISMPACLDRGYFLQARPGGDQIRGWSAHLGELEAARAPQNPSGLACLACALRRRREVANGSARVEGKGGRQRQPSRRSNRLEFICHALRGGGF